MKRILQLIAGLAIVGTVLPTVGFFLGRIEHSTVKTCVLIATITWFVAMPLSHARIWLQASRDRGGVV